MTDTVLVAGDVHLGAEHANVAAFEAFLDDLFDRDDVAELVLLGDVWDLVRRDPFGCAWETSGTISRLQRLAERLPVRFVLGNHDTYLRTLDDDLYDVAFRDEYVLEQNGTAIRFCHGHAFDRFQFDTLSTYLSGPGDRGEIDPTNGRKDPVVAKARTYLQRSRRRLQGLVSGEATAEESAVTYSRRERRAHAHLQTVPEDKLVYGHTHAPYVHHENVAANPGSWKATAPVHDTYLAIENGHIQLYQYRSAGADTRVERTGK